MPELNILKKHLTKSELENQNAHCSDCNVGRTEPFKITPRLIMISVTQGAQSEFLLSPFQRRCIMDL
jgi:hypothetical protein